MANKYTERELYTMAIAEVSNPDLIAFFEKKLGQIEKKALTKKSKSESDDDKAIKSAILDVLADGESRRISDIQKANSLLSPLSNQKVSAMANKLIESGELVKDTSGKATLYKLA